METKTMIGTYSKKVKLLREKKYVVRPVRRKGGWVPPDHDSSFMNDGSKIGIVVPVLPGNVLVNPMKEFEKDDIVTFAAELGLADPNELNIYIKKSFWRGRTVALDRNGLYLDLEKVEDLVRFLILRSDSERIAPSWQERFNKGTYKFALVEQGEELQDNVSNLEDKKNAYILLGKMDTSIEKMKDFLYVYYLTKKDAKNPKRNASIDQLKDEIGHIIEDDLKTYLSILQDDDYTLKLLIQKSVEIGALRRDKHLYSFPVSDKPVGVLEDLMGFLDDPKNQDARMKLMHQVDNTKK